MIVQGQRSHGMISQGHMVRGQIRKHVLCGQSDKEQTWCVSGHEMCLLEL